MNRTKTILILVCVLAVLCGAIAGVKLYTRHVDTINTTDVSVFQISPDTLETFTVKKEDETLTLKKSDSSWSESSDAAFPVDGDKVQEFLSHFEDVHASFIIENVEDYSQYGLTDPTAVVTFTDNGEEKTVTLGTYSTMDEKRYIMTGSGEVYLIDEDLMDVVSTDRDDFMVQDTAPDFEQVDTLNIDSVSEKFQGVYLPDEVHSYSEDYHYYRLTDGKYDPLKDSLVESYIRTVRNLNLTDYATYQASEEDLASYGLSPENKIITLSGTAEDGSALSCCVSIGRVDSGEKDEDDEIIYNHYLRYKDSEIIYHLDSTTYETLADGSYSTLRPPEVLNLDYDKVTSISFTLDSEAYELTKDKPETDSEEEEKQKEEQNTDDSESPKFYLQGQETDLTRIQSAISALSVHSYTGQTPDKPLELTFTVNLESEEYPSFTVNIYQVDGEDCLVTVNGESYGLMTRSLMTDLKEAFTSAVLNLPA